MHAHLSVKTPAQVYVHISAIAPSRCCVPDLVQICSFYSVLVSSCIMLIFKVASHELGSLFYVMTALPEPHKKLQSICISCHTHVTSSLTVQCSFKSFAFPVIPCSSARFPTLCLCARPHGLGYHIANFFGVDFFCVLCLCTHVYGKVFFLLGLSKSGGEISEDTYPFSCIFAGCAK